MRQAALTSYAADDIRRAVDILHLDDFGGAQAQSKGGAASLPDTRYWDDHPHQEKSSLERIGISPCADVQGWQARTIGVFHIVL
jgi:hypothetical protein